MLMRELDKLAAIDCMAEEIVHRLTVIKGMSLDRAMKECGREETNAWNLKMLSLTTEAYDGFEFIEMVYTAAFDRLAEKAIEERRREYNEKL